MSSFWFGCGIGAGLVVMQGLWSFTEGFIRTSWRLHHEALSNQEGEKDE